MHSPFMQSIKHTLHGLRDQRRVRRASLPWAQLEAEAARQGCSAADIFFDRAGRPVPDLARLTDEPAAIIVEPAPGQRKATSGRWGRGTDRHVPARQQGQTHDVWGRGR